MATKPVLPLLRFKYYRPDPWLPEVAHRCDLCGEWITKIGVPEHISPLELHADCPRATAEIFARASQAIARESKPFPKA